MNCCESPRQSITAQKWIAYSSLVEHAYFDKSGNVHLSSETTQNQLDIFFAPLGGLPVKPDCPTSQANPCHLQTRPNHLSPEAQVTFLSRITSGYWHLSDAAVMCKI